MKSHTGKFAKITQFLRKRAGKVCAVVFAALVVGVVSIGATTTNAWGPIRTTYQWPHGATSIQFNSMTANPAWGDERAFTVVRDLGTTMKNTRADAADGNGFKNEVKAQAGHYYMVKMFVHNNAQEQLKLIAKNTKVWAGMVTAPTDGEILIQGAVSASNCGATKANPNGGKPCSVWDEAALTGTDGKYLQASYVPNSARYYNETNKNSKEGFALENSIVGVLDNNQIAGAPIGYKAMDGNLPGCTNYAGFATFIIEVKAVEKPTFTIDKKVRFEGQGKNDWKDSINAKPGEKVEYMITYTNTSSVVQKNPVIADLLPTGVVYTRGASTLSNARFPGVPLKEDYKTSYPSWNIDTDQQGYAGQSDAIVYLKATLPSEENLFCGENVLKNYAIGFVKDAGSITDHADVTIKRDCVPCEYDKYISADDPKCQPPKEEVCSYDPTLPANDPKCKPCKYNDKLPADDPKCVKPANTGVVIPPVAKFGAVLALIFAAAIVAHYHFAKKHSRKSDK